MKHSFFLQGAHNFKGKRKNNLSVVLLSNSSCMDMHKSVWNHIRKAAKRVGVSIKVFQGVISSLRSEKVVGIIAKLCRWDGKDITCRENCMRKHVGK